MTALTVGDLQARVDRGIEWLDVHWPGWANRIDVAHLDIGDYRRCILGQLIGSFYFADMTVSEAVERGFDAPTGDGMDDEIQALGQLWTRVIEARRAVPPDRP